MTDEFAARLRLLEAERFTSPPTEADRSGPPWADDFRALLLVLDRLLSRPGPPDQDCEEEKA